MKSIKNKLHTDRMIALSIMQSVVLFKYNIRVSQNKYKFKLSKYSTSNKQNLWNTRNEIRYSCTFAIQIKPNIIQSVHQIHSKLSLTQNLGKK